VVDNIIKDLVQNGRYLEALPLVCAEIEKGDHTSEIDYYMALCICYGQGEPHAALEYFLTARGHGYAGFWLDYHEACARAMTGDRIAALRLLICCYSMGFEENIFQEISSMVATVGEENIPDDIKSSYRMIDKIRNLKEGNNQTHKKRNDFEVLNERGLFIVGPARSSTSFTLDILNSSREVLLFSEMEYGILQNFPEQFAAYEGRDPIEHFNNKNRSFGSKPECKGYNIPQFLTEHFQKGEFWQYLEKQYRYIGEKVALSPGWERGHFLFEETVSWHANNVPFAKYLLCLRDPAQVARSHVRTFGASGARLISYVISAVEATVELWRSLPNARLLVAENWGQDVGAEIGNWLGLTFDVDYSDANSGKHGVPKGTAYPPELSLFGDILDDMSSMYQLGIKRLGTENKGPYVYEPKFFFDILGGCRAARIAFYETQK